MKLQHAVMVKFTSIQSPSSDGYVIGGEEDESISETGEPVTKVSIPGLPDESKGELDVPVNGDEEIGVRICLRVQKKPAKVLSGLAPLEAVLFDIDRTLCDLDLIHFNAFHKMLHSVQENQEEAMNSRRFFAG
ncbi:hypothetical protein ACE6H2_017898 [Prunus campanulata]